MDTPPRRRKTANTGVVSAAGNGLIVVLFVSIGLRDVLQLDARDIARGAALFALIMTLAVRNLSAFHPFPLFGPANQITTLRAALVALVATFVGAPDTRLVALTAAGIATLATLLDGVDGWFARRTAMSSAFGARFDMEVDALLILVLSVLAWTHDKAGAWVLLSGLIRYAFVGAGLLDARMRRALPPSRRRRVVCVIQVVALIVVILPQLEPPASAWLAAVALLLLVASFAVDSWWLWQHPAPRRAPAHP